MALVPFPGPSIGAHGTAPDEPEEPIDPEDSNDSSSEGQMSFLEHLDELRNRILKSCLAAVAGVVATFAFIQPIFDFIFEPTRAVLPPDVKLIYTQPGEAFSLYVTVALIAGVLVASPFIMYQVWMFVAPGLYANEKKMAYPFVALTTLGLLLGAAFNHYVAFGIMMSFFGSFNTAELAFMPRIRDVFGLYVRMLVVLGVVFQLPTVVFFLAKMRLVTARYLAVNLKYAVLVIFVIAALATPGGDMMGQAVIAAPMLALYLFSIGIAWVVNPRSRGHAE
jgi:sec-independent protein translocase protein TatC